MKIPALPNFRLEGKTALIIGASGSIGFACAAALSGVGAKVVCAGLVDDNLEKAIQTLSETGAQVDVLPLDISDAGSVIEVLKEQPAFDIVLNSAGMARHGKALETTPADFDAVMAVNTKGAYFLSAASAKNMIQEGIPGSIIHLSSQMAHVGGIDRAAYCASKHAMEGMIKAMAMEWGPKNIRINSICPTFIRTKLTQSTFDDPELLGWINSKIKLDRIGEVEDIMGAAVYLASDASSMVTGTSILIDGGWTAG